jgi:anti-sigma factor RsiW
MNRRPAHSLICQHCDGELTAEQSAELERFLATHPELRAAIEREIKFEFALRERVKLVMGQPAAAPPELGSRIRGAMAAAADVDNGPIRADHAWRLWPARLGPDRMNVFAVAATLALIAGAVLFGIFGRTIDDVPPAATVDLASELATFAGAAHDTCAASVDCREQRAQFMALDQAEAMLSNSLNAPVHVADLEPLGYKFVGAGLAGPCPQPVDATFGHIMYQKPAAAGSPSPMVSVFVLPGKMKCGTKVCEGTPCGKWVVAAEPNSRCKHKVMRSTDGRLVYLLVCCDNGDVEPVAKTLVSAIQSSPAGPAAEAN